MKKTGMLSKVKSDSQKHGVISNDGEKQLSNEHLREQIWHGIKHEVEYEMQLLRARFSLS